MITPSTQDWVPLVDVKKKEWMEAVALVFDYFRERTPRSFVEPREASIVWNYKNADIEFGRLQVLKLSKLAPELISKRRQSVKLCL